MNSNRLKHINKEIRQLFNQNITSDLSQLNTSSKTQQPIAKTLYNRCEWCEEVKRQNYQLKQDHLKIKDKLETQENTEKELAAMKEMYDLKCREVQILQKKIQRLEFRQEDQIREGEQIKKSTIQYLQSLVRQAKCQ